MAQSGHVNRIRQLRVNGASKAQAAKSDVEHAAGKAESEINSHVETLAAIVLAIAAVATAWSAYQSSRWGGVMAREFNMASSMRAESVRADTAAGQATIIDVTLASDWTTAQVSGQQELADDLRDRMTPQLTAAMNRWLTGWQPGMPLPPGSPFSDGRYTAPGRDQANELEEGAAETFRDASKAIQRADNYALTAVVFALALFFAGISSRVREASSKPMIYLATGIMVIGIFLLLLQPKDIGV